jgi:hypothetical protein
LKHAKQPLLSAADCHTQPSKFKIKKKGAPNCHYYLQRAFTPDWMGSIALLEQITAFFPRAEKPSEDIISRLFLMNMKGLK